MNLGLAILKICGITLKELFQDDTKKEEIFGTKMKGIKKFPLLIKFIDAKDNLSVQVHPDDEYAKKYENDTGKTEMWYVIDCKENAKIICGMKDNVKQEEIENIVRNGNIRDYLKEVPIHKGDIIYIPAGTLHAILGGTLICEIQQNSNLTYRVYDWDRVGKDGKSRELHIEKAIEVIKQNNKNQIININQQKSNISENRISCDYFKVDSIDIDTKYIATSNLETFEAFMVVKGQGFIKAEDKEYPIKIGDSFIIPANFGKYEIKGNIQLLKAYM
ncbi:MAG: mannose-6-phosphate isomerase, class I [Clostridia bacterium]|nr:mannose-6-phosphate isomerase, class I [Clostridia bacterium]